MTRKDYIAIADAIKATRSLVRGTGGRESIAIILVRATIAERIAEVMAEENPRFDATKFLEACGV